MLPFDLSFTIKGERIEFDIDQARKIKPIEEIEKLIEVSDSWYKKGKEQKVENIIRKTEFLEAETLSQLLDFEDNLILMNWIYTLPPEIPILIKGDEIHFQFEETPSEDVHKLIDILLEKYSQYEQNQIDKS